MKHALSDAQIVELFHLAFLQVAHMANGYCCYIPTPDALAGGGYETTTSYGSRLAPEALAMIEEASVALLKKLARQK